MPVFCILLAPPRSGTTMLGEAVARAFQAVWPQEIFHRDYAGPAIDFRSSADVNERCNFFNFRHELFKRRPELSFPSKENQSSIFDAYLEQVTRSEPSERYLFDIKYSSWHHLDWYWSRPYQRPFLLECVVRSRFPIVHLKRENLFALYCSHLLAQQTNVWRRRADEEESDPQPMTIDPSDCLHMLREWRATTALFDDWLSGYPHSELHYEELLTGGRFSDAVVETFSRIYGSPPSAPLSTDYRKIAPPLREVVANQDAVLRALKGSEFIGMAEDALRSSSDDRP